MRPYILAETNWKNIKDSDFELAVLPWSATEAHNYHLPYSSDIIEAEFIAHKSAEKAYNRFHRKLGLDRKEVVRNFL